MFRPVEATRKCYERVIPYRLAMRRVDRLVRLAPSKHISLDPPIPHV